MQQFRGWKWSYKCIFIDSVCSVCAVEIRDKYNFITKWTLSCIFFISLSTFQIRHFLFVFFCLLRLIILKFPFIHRVNIHRSSRIHKTYTSTALFMYLHVAVHRKTAWLLFLYTKSMSSSTEKYFFSLLFRFRSFAFNFVPRSFLIIAYEFSFFLFHFLTLRAVHSILSSPNSPRVYPQTCFLHFRLGIRILCFLPPSEIHCIIFLFLFRF